MNPRGKIKNRPRLRGRCSKLGCVSDGERIKIQQRVFEAIVQNLESQIDLGRRNFLAESSKQCQKPCNICLIKKSCFLIIFIVK